MVDEFQDTNRLQCEVVDLLTGSDTERFFVGDESAPPARRPCGFFEAGATLSARTQPAQIRQALRRSRRDRQLHRLYARRPRRVCRVGVLGQASRRVGELRETLLEGGTLASSSTSSRPAERRVS